MFFQAMPTMFVLRWYPPRTVTSMIVDHPVHLVFIMAFHDSCCVPFYYFVTYTVGMSKCSHVVVFLLCCLDILDIHVGFCKHWLEMCSIFVTWSIMVMDPPCEAGWYCLSSLWLPTSSNDVRETVIHCAEGNILVEECLAICTKNNIPPNNSSQFWLSTVYYQMQTSVVLFWWSTSPFACGW